MGINILTKTLIKWPLQKSKLSPVSSIKRRPRSSSKIPSETSVPVTSSPMRLSMRSSPPSTRTDQVPSRRTKWSSSSSSSSEVSEQHQTHATSPRNYESNGVVNGDK